MKRFVRITASIITVLSLVSVFSIPAFSGATFDRVKNWDSGKTLKSYDLNAEFNNILNNLDPSGIDDESTNAAAMQATTDPYPGATISLSTDLAGELQRIRYLIKQLSGETYWYVDPDTTIASLYTDVTGNVEKVSKHDDLADAITDIGATVTTLYVDEDVVMDEDVTVPTTLTFEIMPGNEISGAFTLTINGPFKGSPGCFGTGVIVTGLGKSSGVTADLWGNNAVPGTTDMTAELQAAYTAAGNACPVIYTDTLYVTDQIALPLTSTTSKASIGSSYFVGGGRSHYHILNGITDTSKSIFYAPNDLKVTHNFTGLNVNMNDKESEFFTNEVKDPLDADGKAARIHAHDMNIDNCGGNGIVLNDGANTSILDSVNIIGISSASVEDGTGIVAGSIGFDVQSADIKVTNCEIKGKFGIGIKTTATHCNIVNNFFDQCNTPAVDIGRNNKWVGNRFQYGYAYGMKLGDATTQCINPSIVGNVFARNNTTKELETGSYDGINLYLYNVSSPTITGNAFASTDIGIKIGSGAVGLGSSGGMIMANEQWDIDTGLFDYSGNDTVAENIIQDNSAIYRIVGSAITSGFNLTDTYAIFTGGIKASYGIPPGKNRDFNFSTSANNHIITDGNMLEVNCTAGGQTLTITGTDDIMARGFILIVRNDGSQAFTLATAAGAITGTTAITAGNSFKYWVDTDGNIIEQ